MAVSRSGLEVHRYVEHVHHKQESIKIYADDKRAYRFIKRGLDIFGAVVCLILSAPLFGIISLFYLFGSMKGPVFFRQERTGLGGRTFIIYKFRSMTVNAEDQLKTNKVLYYKYIQNNYKLEDDPRVTKVGRFLRKTSLDELPQLINVLKGEMSLVGPRPVVKDELKEYGDRASLFLSAKPGLTGYWQAYGRSEIEYPERVNVELYYILHQSLLFDFKIILKTFASVVNRKGAY